MRAKAAITVHRARDEVRRLWESSEYQPDYIEKADAGVTFRDAPGDRGTEIHVDLERDTSAVRKLFAAPRLAKVKDELRRFKQLVETGEIARSDSTPEGERPQRKLKQRPAQPLQASEREKAGV